MDQMTKYGYIEKNKVILLFDGFEKLQIKEKLKNIIMLWINFLRCNYLRLF